MINKAIVVTLILLALLIGLGALLEILGDALGDNPRRCAAKKWGGRCVHDEDHPGSHRDEYGDYWN